MRYRAFLSYSHADEKWARWLMRRLEAYRVPRNLVGAPGRDGPIPAKLGQMFRDRDELPSAGDLSSTISAALADSSALVVICSPSSARSRWVNAEIDAFRASGRGERIFSFIIDGDPASREPGVASFPQALIEPETPGGPEREPLAADARKAGDGRDRAFLKLVAGLLGVGFDDLAQREAQQRHRRMAFITMASLAGMAIALSLAVTAYIARNDAERRQAQAEDILGFMLGDLRKNLTKVGRLDLMRSVDDKATGYFATLNPRDLSDRALEEQARSLTGIGEVRVNEGNHKEAMTAFREAHARSTALYEREPGNGQRLFDLAQAEYWIGFVAWQQGNFEETALWFGKYRDSGIKLAAMDRSNFAWQKEAAYGYHNMAVLDESRGRYEPAEKAMLAERELYVGWLKQHPKDVDLRFEAANIDSWLGSLSLRHGRLEQAEQYFKAYADANAMNMREDTGNAKWKQNYSESLLFLYAVQIQRGRLDQAKTSVSQAMSIAESLSRQDPSNSDWMMNLGECRFKHAVFSRNDADRELREARAIIEKAFSLNPKNERTADMLAKVFLAQGQLALISGDASGAAARAREASAVIDPKWKLQPNEDLRLRKAQIHILQGNVAKLQGNKQQAQAEWQTTVKLLAENPGGELPFTRLEDLVLALELLGQNEQAAPYKERLKQAGFVPFRAFS
ncbi:TIR domain-containing protein [Arenimonas sp. GDDSR-1]|uniref:TIR domain-containing protein n=1 Tax=Arenimonas sp. GDDSR-1 TaxID=2950125 RepID=UPI0026333429|nr:TIR domain-containing protein [Arenimonas sp. GDDSR-1]